MFISVGRARSDPFVGLAESRPAKQRTVLRDFRAWAENYAGDFNAGKQSTMLEQGLSLARQRRAALVKLMSSDPTLALAEALPEYLRTWLPPAVLAEMETPLSGIGDLLVFCAISNPQFPGSGGVYGKVRLNDRVYRGVVRGRGLPRTTKLQIPLQGISLDGMIVLDNSTPPGQEIQAHSNQNDSNAELREMIDKSPGRRSGVPLEQKRETTALIIRVDFSDMPGDPRWLAGGKVYTAASVQSWVDSEISTYIERSSYSNATVRFTVTPQVYRLPATAAFYATNGYEFQLYFDAVKAARTDYAMTNYDRVIVLCSWLGSIPNSQIQFGGVSLIGTPITLVNGELDFRVLAHELGHTFGLYHANFWHSSNKNPTSDDGTSLDYSDPFDTMGVNWSDDRRVDFNPWFKQQLGWIHDDQVQAVSTSGVFRVYRFDDGAARGILALKISKDASRDYWIAFRRNFTDNPGSQQGAYVFWGYHEPRPSDLLGLGPVTGNPHDPGLVLGKALIDTEAKVMITPIAQGGLAPNEYLDVQIKFGAVLPQTPPLRMSMEEGRMILSWPVASPGLVLETRDDLAASEAWVLVTNQPSIQGTNFVLTDFPQAPAALYRLRRHQ